MAGMTQYAQKKVGDHMTGVATYAQASAFWMSLHTGDPGEAGSVAFEVPTPVGTTGYQRIDLLGKMSAVELTTGKSTLNTTVNQGPALIDWGTLTHAAWHDAQTAGNMVLFGEMSDAQVLFAGKQFQLIAGQLEIDWD